MGLNKRKRGRPLQEVTRERRFVCLMNDDEMAMLNFLSLKEDKSMSEILREALKERYNLVVHGKKYKGIDIHGI